MQFLSNYLVPLACEDGSTEREHGFLTIWQLVQKVMGIGEEQITYEPRHEISNNVVCATSKGSDQPAHARSLISAIASRLKIL